MYLMLIPFSKKYNEAFIFPFYNFYDFCPSNKYGNKIFSIIYKATKGILK